MAEENVVDTLEIEIRSRASKAAEEVASLAASVGDFGKNVSAHIKDMTSFADAVAKIAESLGKLSNVKGLKGVLDNVAKVAKQEKSVNVGRVFRPAIPPTVLSGTVKGKTRNVDLTRIGYGPYKYDKSADEIAKEINSRYRTGISNKAISAEIQRIRNEMIGGNTRWVGEAHGLAKDIAGNAQSEELTDSLKNAINRCYSTIAVSFEDAVHLARQYGKTKAGYSKKRELEALFREYVQQARLETLSDQEARSYITRSGGLAGVNEALKNAGVNAQIVYSSEGHGFEDLFAGEMRSAEEFKNSDEYELKEAIDGLADRHVETVVDALLSSKDNGSRHDAFLSKYNEGRGITEAELTQDLWSYLADEIWAGKPIDPAKERAITESETKRAVERAAQEAREAARIAKEESTAWKEQDAWNREQDRQYKEDYGGINKRQQMNLAWSEHARESVPSEIDETRQLIDDYNASENEKYEAYMKELAEGIVQSQASGGTADIKSIVEEATGISRAMKDAEDSARAMMDAMNQPEAFKSARESAETFQRAWQETGAEQARAAREASRATWEAEMEQMRAYGDAKKAAAEQDALARALRDNTPELIAARRSRADKIGILEGYDKMFSTNIPGLADRGLAAGLIDENTANAMKEAAGCAADMKHELEGAGEAAGDTADKIGEIADECEDAEENTFSLKKALSAVGSMISKSIVGQLARVAKMRGLRAIVRGLASGFKEGIGNMYQWSKGLDGHFASALDTASTKLLLIKNSVATAFAPALEALVPVLSRVTSWVNAASNAVAQFMAKLTGASTWTKATESVQEWAKDATDSTKGVDNSVKDLLADWDELNIIQSEAGGSGGGSGSKNITDYSKMFEEMSIFDDWTDFFDEIKASVIAIGAGIAGWFLLDTATSFLEKIGYASDKVAGIKNTIARGMAGAVLLTVGLSLASAAGKDLALNGLTGETIAEGIGGMFASGLGGYFIGTSMLTNLFGITTAGTIGTIVGVGLAIGMSIYSYVKEMNSNAQEYIRSELENEVYGFDVKAEAETLSVTVKNAEQARLQVRQQLSRVMTTIDIIRLGVKKDAYKTLYDQVLDESDGLLPKIRKDLEEDKNIITFYYELKQKTGTGLSETDKDGNYTNLEAFQIDMKANAWLEEHYTDLGRQFAECFKNGEVKKIKEDQAEVALAIANQLTEAERAAEAARGEAQAEIDVRNALKGTNRETVMRNFSGVLDEYEATLADLEQSSLENYIISQSAKLARLEAAGADESLIKGVRDNLEEAKRELAETDFKAKVRLEYQDKESQLILDFMQEYFGQTGDWGHFKTEVMERSIARNVSAEEMAKTLGWQLYGNANELYGMDFGDTLFKDFGIGLDEILSDDILKGLKEALLQYHDEGFVRKVFENLGFDGDRINDLFGQKEDATAEKPEALTAGDLVDEDDFDIDIEDLIEKPAVVNAGDLIEKPVELTAEDLIEKPANIETVYVDGERYDIGEPVYWDIPSSSGAGGGGGSPTGWFSRAEEGFMDVDASGIATADSVEQGAALVNGGMEQIQNMITTVNSFLRNIEEYNRITAGKDLTVNITPSSGFAQTMRRSGARLEAVTGTVLKR